MRVQHCYSKYAVNKRSLSQEGERQEEEEEEEEEVGDRRKRRRGWVREEYNEEEEERGAGGSGSVRHRRDTSAVNDGDIATGIYESSRPSSLSLLSLTHLQHLPQPQLTLHTSPHHPGIPASSWGCVFYWYYWWLQECTCLRADHTHCTHLVTARIVSLRVGGHSLGGQYIVLVF